ncbi:MAG: MarR family transcriptional regulator, partial [Longimicrobiales bacterium]
PLSPVRWLVLAQLQHATPFGFSARRLARGLRVSPSTLAYHLDALERAGFIVRTPCTVHDGRKVWVRLTDVGRYALHRLGGQPSRPPMRSPAIASP